MTTITIFPEHPPAQPQRFRAVAGEIESVGATAGEALNALTAEIGGLDSTTLVVVQPMRPDALFTADQQRRLGELMTAWRAARDASAPFPVGQEAELDALVEAELRAATQRSATGTKEPR